MRHPVSGHGTYVTQLTGRLDGSSDDPCCDGGTSRQVIATGRLHGAASTDRHGSR